MKTNSIQSSFNKAPLHKIMFLTQQIQVQSHPQFTGSLHFCYTNLEGTLHPQPSAQSVPHFCILVGHFIYLIIQNIFWKRNQYYLLAIQGACVTHPTGLLSFCHVIC